MTQIDFYILAASIETERHLFTCRLTEKAFKQGHSIYIHGRDETHAQVLNEQLWSFRPASFLPNALITAYKDEPIAIGHQHPPPAFNQVMINLSGDIPHFFSRFERVIEIVIKDAIITEQTRKHYRFYRDRGYPLNNHDMR